MRRVSSTFAMASSSSTIFTTSAVRTMEGSATRATITTVKRRTPKPISVSTSAISSGRAGGPVFDCRDHSWIPEKDMKPRDISPTMMKVMPRPRSGGGTLE